ncbi:DNA mismatch repair endonuclease MutL [Tuwongella immobilis]|uniref:DNA mismatch repair protein MutL n=1 Tax=Tuwongella immobilis TaxID=692036 RepID=A0A6C2YJK0_9BACT|nr:DNA mismatch repair endonuclease MutL [Tuwongella immobilis]VIP01750.1 dna mismatch repair protein : DNA mismatch repair protein MutL OS=Rhodopirellula maiorica SM1 GN=mutL PE=3 SV=1: HATPase_c_3: DNA_mis_repair: MutL_C [Tuwongella immobilis]VTR99338.1 dna mismatch repair protein : DNA mismatch repair protein MutL OS=Rhodopirellula maiorica SM1 GN=mutL PE=3 SV=1: HATPase_c_3: DNA_mis_repair: MutL_C [Tuwongella immobilis]
MPRIQQLTPAVVSQIAAGEVIERPSSVLKELLENSIDAGSTRIDIELEQGGTERLCVFDNGCGIFADDLPLAFSSHATSKLTHADDLFKIGTLGFRGEALASIGGVARVLLQSRPPECDHGAEIRCEGGELGTIRPWNGAVGTRIEVKHLFFNTPVRKKFLRAIPTELGHIIDTVIRLAMAYPTLHLTLKHNGKLIHEIPATMGLTERIGMFFGGDVRESLREIRSNPGGMVDLWGYIADPSCDRGNAKLQYLYVNGRWIRDRSLSHAIQEGYRNLIMVGRYPIAFLFLDIPPDQVDVNVHPTKAEVRFRDSGALFSLIRQTIAKTLLGSNAIPALTVPAQPSAKSSGANSPAQSVPASGNIAGTIPPKPLPPMPESPPLPWERPTPRSESRPVPKDYPLPAFLKDLPPNRPVVGESLTESANQPISVREDGEIVSHEPTLPTATPTLPDSPSAEQPADSSPVAFPEVRTAPDWGLPDPPQIAAKPLLEVAAGAIAPANGAGNQRAIQIHDSFLVVETPEGMLVIDQHALHERILFEQLQRRVRSGSLERQRLLIPEPIELPGGQAAVVLEYREELLDLGLEISEFGGGTILLESYPVLLHRSTPSAILQGAIDCLLAKDRPPTRDQLFNHLLATMACKAAVKAGDRLTPEEIQALMAQRQLAEDSTHCPHGRPTSLVFSRQELEKQFRRI